MGRIPTFGGGKFPVNNATDPAKSQNPKMPKKGQGPQTFAGDKFGSGTDTKDPNKAYNPAPKSGQGPQTHTPGHRFGKTLDTKPGPLTPR